MDTDSFDDLTEEQRQKLLIYPYLLERRDSFSCSQSTITNFDSSHSTSPIIKAFYAAIGDGDGMFSAEAELFQDQAQETKLQEFIREVRGAAPHLAPEQLLFSF